MPEPTPGQRAYEAYWRMWNDGRPPQLLWEQLIPDNQRAWEAAAQAVLAPRLTDQAGKMHLLLAYLLDHATPEAMDALHLWLTDATTSLHAEKKEHDQ